MGRPLGTIATRRTTITSVDCLTCREAISARLDGEPEPVPAAETDEHLFHESTAWNLALGVGLLWAAFRTEPNRTEGNDRRPPPRGLTNARPGKNAGTFAPTEPTTRIVAGWPRWSHGHTGSVPDTAPVSTPR
jgi:hypothetical protein